MEDGLLPWLSQLSLVLVTTLLSFSFLREGRQSLSIGKESDPVLYCAVKETKDKDVVRGYMVAPLYAGRTELVI